MDQYASISSALMQSPVPKEIAELMIAVLPNAFGGDSGNRHRFQEQILDVVRKELQAGEDNLTSNLDEIKAKIAGAEDERDRRNLAVTEAQRNVESRAEQLSVACAAEVAAKEQVQAAKEKRASAEAEKAAVAAGTAEASTTKQVIEGALEELVKLLQSEPATEPPTQAVERTAVLRKSLDRYLRDPAMLDAVELALVKAPSARGSFDKLVLEQLDQEAKKVLVEADSKLAEARPKAESAAAALIVAESTYSELVDRQQNAEIDASNAQAAKIESETMLREAQRGVSSLKDEIEAALKSVEVADTTLQEFKKSVEDFENFRCPKIEEIVAKEVEESTTKEANEMSVDAGAVENLPVVEAQS